MNMVSVGFDCDRCHKPVMKKDDGFSTGYASYGNQKICYACCAVVDREYMDQHGKITLYLIPDVTRHPGGTTKVYFIKNWPGTLSFLVHMIHHSTRHNIGKYRHDAWFKDQAGNWWHGVQYGENTQLIHCRRLKRKSRRM